ncbi:MAG: non-canonical purine NTP pyrophosphatase [Candidatus Paceibacterota bacterium]
MDEIQSLNLKEIVEHKVRQAYELIRKPVIVEDVALGFAALVGYFDGENLELFEDSLDGKIVETPFGENRFGWDKIFIP